MGDGAGVLDLVPVDAVVNVMLASLPEAAASASRGGASASASRPVGRVGTRVGIEHSPVTTKGSSFDDENDRLDANAVDDDNGRVAHDVDDDVVVYHVATSTLNPLNFEHFMHIVSRWGGAACPCSAVL